MANQRAMSDEEIQLRRRARRRLIGAVTLVTVMVVILPMVLDREPKQSGQDIVINIPPQTPDGEFSSRIVPVPEQQKPVPAPAEPEKAAQAAAQPQQAAPQPSAPPAKPVEKKAEALPARNDEQGRKAASAASEVQLKESSALQEKHKDEKPASASAKQDGGAYVIQLGAFANRVNARERQSRLAALKVKFYTETVKTPSGDKMRVRAGPYATRQEAERVQAKLKAAGIQDGVVAEKKE